MATALTTVQIGLKKILCTLVNLGFLNCFVVLRFFQFYIKFSLHILFLRDVVNNVFFNFYFFLVKFDLIVFL